ncbi:MAG: HEAT repeat domain-containing protein [Candidatus Latescibacteria bacterium]|nr:HEAT repeat domain-containing protein [Candidatus Latescibacterota bacterium]
MNHLEESDSNLETLNYSTIETLVQDFASRGLVVLPPESLGIPSEVHDSVYNLEKKIHGAKLPVTPKAIPDVLEVINSPGVIEACNKLIGKNWAIVPFTHNASFTSGARDQHWHKDDNGPYNGRKQRHHQAVQIEMLYYPQTVREDMGPTATVPYSHYWTFNHEENHDNFAGADHLDFNYQLSGMERESISGKDSKYTKEDIVNRRTAHDSRMRNAVTDTTWPLVHQLEAGPLRAGSIVFYSHNTFHRGNHRRDDWQTWADNPRFMWRFYLYRTTDSVSQEPPTEPNWNHIDPMTQVDLSQATDDVTTVWRYHNYWIQTGQAPPPRPETATLSATEREQEAKDLFQQLHKKNDEAEPDRMGAAYKLASIGDSELAVKLLGKALYYDRENGRRAATYGLIAVGPDATDTFLEATKSPLKWVRKAGVYGLGDASPLTEEVLKTTVSRLQDDPSVYVRSVAAGTLGCLGRRAVATRVGNSLVSKCLSALVESLSYEENRLCMNEAQGRSIKFVRPTDDCDVCEGGGIDFGLARFEKVRSAVRENVLWSIVILCSHGAGIIASELQSTISVLREVIRTDKNVICVGFAQDALSRLANLGSESGATHPPIDNLQNDLLEILDASPVQSWEALVRSGLGAETVAKFDQSK